jgi:hypothetical protein
MGQHLLLFVSLAGMGWNVIGILVCISLVAKGIEHFLMYLLAV